MSILRKTKKEYVYLHYKYEGLEKKPKKKEERRYLSPASKRWATMSWMELTKELLYYKLKYRDAQLMAYNNTLPADFGLKRKKVAQCPQ